jgi:hypothetical protein
MAPSDDRSVLCKAGSVDSMPNALNGTTSPSVPLQSAWALNRFINEREEAPMTEVLYAKYQIPSTNSTGEKPKDAKLA